MLEGNQDTATETKPGASCPQGTQRIDKAEFLFAGMNPLDRRNSHDGVTFSSNEQLQLNELREARIRALQMEKTMRWWSDCTANWRDKWGQVKNERNKAREDIKVLKQKLDNANNEIYKLKRERNEFKEGNSQLRKDVEKMAAELKRDRRAFVQPMRFTDGSSAHVANAANIVQSKPGVTEASKYDFQPLKDNMPALITDAEAFVEITKAHEGDKRLDEDQSFSVDEQSLTLNGGVKRTNEEHKPEHKLKKELDTLKEKLKDTENKVTEESQLKEGLSKTLDDHRTEIENLKGSLQEETNAKENAINELTRLKDQQKEKENEKQNTANIRVAYSTDSVDRKVKDLRLEIERLQKDNAAEWNKREKLETQKLNIERENKKLRHQITDLGNELKTKISEVNQAADYKLKQVQKELDEKKKELADLKVSHMKLKRIYQDKKEDILHNKTRVDHHEDEIKKLRSRIDELKMKLTAAEDEVDQKENLARKLQRSLDDQTQQSHVLRVQMEHLQSRWKQMTISTRAPKRGERNSCTDDESLLEIDL